MRNGMRDFLEFRFFAGLESPVGSACAGRSVFSGWRLGWRPGRACSRSAGVLLLLCLGHLVPPVAAEEWSQFRGWNSTGVVETSALPVRFGPHRNLVWRAPVAPGQSSPVLTRDRIFLSAVDGDGLWVICLDRSSGELLWKQEVPRPRSEVTHQANGPASPTPVTDGSNVVAFFGDFGLISFDAEGRERWRLPLGPFINPMGQAASPILADGRVLMICDQESGSFFVAADQMTGEVLWRVERPGHTRGFSTPVLYRPEGGALQVLISGSHQLTAYSVDSGEEIWWVRGLTWQMKSTPVIDRDTLYLSGWAGGADDSQREEVGSFADFLSERDADGDGRLSQQEISGLRLRWDFSRLDLDRSGFLEDRDWRIYRAKRSARNGALGIRLGAKET